MKLRGVVNRININVVIPTEGIRGIGSKDYSKTY